MDIATLVGIMTGVFFIVYPIINGGSPQSFYDLNSIFIVLGGGLASVLISYRLNEVTKVMKVAVKAFVGKARKTEDTISLLVSLSHKARREGLLALEPELDEIDDEYLKESLGLVIDGIEPDIIVDSMDLEIENLRLRHEKGQGIFKSMGTLFPAWGMIGTLIGLISLLKNLDDPSKIGPSMAVALVTTFYGSVLANFICIPIANKLALKSKEEIRHKSMIIEGILAIQSGENPKIVEHKLKLFLSPEQKLNYLKQYSKNNNSAAYETQADMQVK